MSAAVVVEADSVADGVRRVLDAVEALAMNALLLQRPDNALDHAVLPRAMRRDELLLQAIAADQGGVAPRDEDQPVVRPQKELLFHLAERAEPSDQCMLQRAGSSGGLSGPSEVPARKLAGVAIDDQSERGPAVTTGPDPAEVR